jgi:hypothetical protein
MKPKVLTTMQMLKHQGIEPAARLADALHEARTALLDDELTGTKQKKAVEALQGLVNLVGKLGALFFHWQATGNNYFAVEALVLAVDGGFGPPKWALQALQPGLAEHIKHPDVRRLPAQLGLHRRGKTQPVKQYQDRRKLALAMLDMHKLCAGCGIKPMRAAHYVEKKLRAEAEAKTEPAFIWPAATLASYYARHWRPLYEGAGKLGPLDPTARQYLIRTFPASVRRELHSSADLNPPN